MNDPHPRWLFLVQRITLLLFAFLPVGFSLIVQIQYLSGNWSIPSFLRTSLLVGLILLPLATVLIRDDLWDIIEGTGYIPLIWFITLAVALRLIVLPLLSTNFTSDMLDMHLFAVDVASGQPYANLTEYQGIPWAVHLNMTGLLTSVVYRIFGATFATGKMFMVVLAGISVWLIYLAGKELAGARVGLVAAAIYGTLPSLVTYSGVLSGEHLALPLVILSIFLYAKIKNSIENRLRYAVAGYALCGITIGLIDWFRPGGIILVTALLISDLIYWTREKKAYQQLLPLGLLLVSYLTVSSTAVFLSERFFHTDVMSAIQQSGHFILLGLNVEHKGAINNEDRQIAFDVYEQFGDDNTAANLYLVEMALERLKGQPVLELFSSKFALLWSNHWQLFQISLNGSNDQETVKVMSDIDSVIYLLITVFIGVNIYASFINRSHPAVFAMQLFILGFAIWSLVLEVQNRYAISTFPYQILLGTLGIFDLAAYMKTRKSAPSS